MSLGAGGILSGSMHQRQWTEAGQMKLDDRLVLHVLGSLAFASQVLEE